jgi:DNA-binding SARP family transcriptional activator
VLGGFACAPLAGSDAAAKAASRPLALLRRLAAEGGLEPVPTEALAQALWPGEGREGRDKALEVTLARLRRLLGDASAVLLQDRRLRLNPDRVWLDSAALARVLGLLEHGLAQGHGDDALQPLWDEAMALWRGPLLAGEAADRWLDDARGRLRRRMAAALHAAAERPGHRARCLRATAADPALAEDL